jgi:chemotaxis protein CheD
MPAVTNLICLGLGEQAVSRSADDMLVAYGLGSCLGISMIDPVTRVSGLLHAVLPDDLNDATHPAVSGKYVDSGIESLLAAMLKSGASRSRLIVRMVGGANMLITAGATNAFDIGTRNIEKAREVFKRLNIKLAAEEVGGHTGRTVRVYVAESRVTVKVIGEKEHDL